MHRQVNAIAGRLSLRAPQRHSLEILDRITELATLKKGDDPGVALEAIKAEWPTVSDFEREFPSVCFALATGVGSDVQRSLATVVAGGLIPATLLTLFIIPTLYFALEGRAAKRAPKTAAAVGKT